jgi:hypothetical protein
MKNMCAKVMVLTPSANWFHCSVQVNPLQVKTAECDTMAAHVAGSGIAVCRQRCFFVPAF